MGRFGRLSALGAVLFAAALPSAAQQPLTLAEVGRVYVGGQLVFVDGAEHRVRHAAVDYLVPETRRAKAPVVLYPNQSLSSYVFLATPDGREGWAQALARGGYGTYVVDAPRALAEDGTPDTDELWQRWGFGSGPGTPYPNTRFPVRAVDQLYAALVAPPAAASGGTVESGAALLSALLERTGPAVLLAHGDAAHFAFAAAAARPQSVLAIVGIEPEGCGRSAAEVEPIAGIPFLAIFGDYIQSRGQAENLISCRALAEALSARRGGRGEVHVLPEESIFGNTHLLMQDDNSLDIAARVVRWLDRRAN